MRVCHLALGCMLAYFSSFAAAAETSVQPNPSSIAAAVAKRGSKVIIQELYENPTTWTAVTDGIATGEERWLQVYRTLKPASDAGTAEMLDIALSKALVRHPKSVLSFMSREHNAYANMICGRLDDDADAKTFIPFLEKQRAAVSKVGDKKLAIPRSECLTSINKAIKAQKNGSNENH
jgi:hypothetical protein